MPSGKQLSFQYGEVSPALRYKVDGPWYSGGLNKLKNCYIRKAGGFSNRSGFKYVADSVFQNNQHTSGGLPNVKLYSFTNSLGERYLIEQALPGQEEYALWNPLTAYSVADYVSYLSINYMRKVAGTTATLPGSDPANWSTNLASDRTRSLAVHKLQQDVSVGQEEQLNQEAYGSDIFMAEADGYPFFNSTNLIRGRIHQQGDTCFITWGDGNLAIIRQEHPSQFYFETAAKPTDFQTPGGAIGFTSINSTGPAPDIPVAYLITQELTDGTETIMHGLASLTQHPHSQKSTRLNVTLVGGPNIKQYNIYRSDGGADTAGTGTVGAADILLGEHGHFALVGRLPAKYTAGLTTNASTFSDYLATALFSAQPPINRRLYLNSYSGNAVVVGGLIEDNYERGALQVPQARELSNCLLIGSYQQRRIIIPSSKDPTGASTGFSEGTVVVSKLGTPGMLDTPLTLNNTDAFDFSLPFGFRKPIVGLLDRLPRLVVMSRTEVIVIQGGEGGVLSPSTINPYVITGEGCSRDIAPVSLGRRGYFINADHTKLMGLEFQGGDDSAPVQVKDISLLADHFLSNANITGMEVVKGVEDIVYILREDGTAVNITVSAEDLSISGWGSLEVDGFIEAIHTLERQKDQTLYEYDINLEKYPAVREYQYEGLYASIIRDGVRRIEVLTSRTEVDSDKKFFVDSGSTFGKRSRYVPSGDDYENPLLNIQTGPGVDYLAGSVCSITMISSLDTWHNTTTIPILAHMSFSLDKRYDFYYEVLGVTTRLRFTPNNIVSGTVMEGTFDIDVPAHLQDAEALAASTKTKDQSRWLPAYNSVSGLAHLASKDVSVFTNEGTLSSPYNTVVYPTILTVSAGGVLTFGAGEYYNYGVVGLPYISEGETLDLDTSDERTFTDANKLINAVGVAVHETKGVFVGQSEAADTPENMNLLSNSRNTQASEVAGNMNGHFRVEMAGSWEKTGRVLIRQYDPEPMTVLAVYPKGMVSE